MNKLNVHKINRMACYTEMKYVNLLQKFNYVGDFEAFDFKCKFHKLQTGQ